MLRELPGHYVAPLNALILCPGLDGMLSELEHVVADDHARLASPLGEYGKLPDFAMARNRDIRNSGSALVGDVIDHLWWLTRRPLAHERGFLPTLRPAQKARKTSVIPLF